MNLFESLGTLIVCFTFVMTIVSTTLAIIFGSAELIYWVFTGQWFHFIGTAQASIF